MTVAHDRSLLRRKLELGRLLSGSLLEFGIKAYGAGAVASVAISDAETVGGKGRDAIAAVPNLSEEYRDAKYVVDHREEIQAAIDYLNEHTIAQEQVEESAGRATETLRGIETTYSEVLYAKEALPGSPIEAWGHARDAWEAKPDLDSISHLVDVAERVSPFVGEVEVLIPVYYGGLIAVMDNFASDEILGTLAVMGMVLTLAVVLGQAVGFWVRRGRPGVIARVLQRIGARAFRRWYVSNLSYALSPPLYAAARERIQRDIVTDPRNTLDPEALRELELYFKGGRGGVQN